MKDIILKYKHSCCSLSPLLTVFVTRRTRILQACRKHTNLSHIYSDVYKNIILFFLTFLFPIADLLSNVQVLQQTVRTWFECLLPILATRVNCNFFNVSFLFLGVRTSISVDSKLDGKFALTILSTPNIIVPVFSEQPQQHCLSIITILAGQFKYRYLKTGRWRNVLY